MSLTQETIQLLLFLLPGFIALKLVQFRCDVDTPPFPYFVVNALTLTLVAYLVTDGVLALFGVDPQADPFSLPRTATSVGVGGALGFALSVCINRDWGARLLHWGDLRLSTHERIFSGKAIQHFRGKWHVVGFKDGKEVLGVIREFNTTTCEVLLEGAQWIRNGDLAPDRAWFYIPPGAGIQYIRTVNEEGE